MADFGARCRCNGFDHTLSGCPEPIDPANPTPYATCYICLSTGHISAACPQNSKGVYVNGGHCKVCKSTAHRAKDCPVELERIEKEGYDFREEKKRRGEMVLGMGDGAGADEDDFMVQSRVEGLDFGKKKGKGKMEKKPPANNGIRGPTKRIEAGGDDPKGTDSSQGNALLPDTPQSTAAQKAKAKVVKF
jgi:zinc finger CCHC domain-containing protein 9